MKTILIPTDFSPASLNCIPNLCAQFHKEQLNFVFVHLFKVSDSINDLLMLSRRSREYDYISDDFYTKLRELKQEFSQLNLIKIEFFFGSTMVMFRNFIEENEVSHILQTQDCVYAPLNKSSVDPFNLTAKLGLPLVALIEVKKAVSDVASRRYAEINMAAEVY
ncbi:hypothetical protein [Pedobacter sp. MC2016-24]|uniref:hypothetical protein n=1 Tax=Pedobacter sp. MC2016-24 TaxID=2780090 RepID=UPI001881D14F|nr:hypothetical protein [Pedobacter sp. MC2016-24]MBE9599371.1 hypothetical protein [Pedobacter sp. MC2016-24]